MKRGLIFLFFVFFLVALKAQKNQLYTDDTANLKTYSELYRNLSEKIIISLKDANFDVKNHTLLFSIRFNIDSSGSIINFEYSRFSPPAIIKCLRLHLINQYDISLKTAINLKLIEKQCIVIPIIISPDLNISKLSKSGNDVKIADTLITFNVDMIREMFDFTKSNEKTTLYHFWYPPFPGLIFTPVTYPYTYSSPYGTKFNKYYKKTSN